MWAKKREKETANGTKIEMRRLRPQKIKKKKAILMHQVCELMY
jgi:hypothetical protein